MPEYSDSINGDDTTLNNLTGDDSVIPFEDRDYDDFRIDQDKAFGGLYGC